jgi:cephalosporin-C deacetylase-like acetyl esterase
MKIIKGYNNTFCVLEEKTYKVLNVSQNVDELITYLRSEKQKKEQEIKLIQEHIRYFDIQR